MLLNWTISLLLSLKIVPDAEKTCPVNCRSLNGIYPVCVLINTSVLLSVIGLECRAVFSVSWAGCTIRVELKLQKNLSAASWEPRKWRYFTKCRRAIEYFWNRQSKRKINLVKLGRFYFLFFCLFPEGECWKRLINLFIHEFSHSFNKYLIWVYFHGGSDGKASAYSAGDLGSIPGLGGSPGEGNGNPLQYPCLENPMDGGAW